MSFQLYWFLLICLKGVWCAPSISFCGVFVFLSNFPVFIWPAFFPHPNFIPYSYIVFVFFSLFFHLDTDPLISSEQYLGFTFEITCHASHSPCLTLSSTSSHLMSGASILPSFLSSIPSSMCDSWWVNIEVQESGDRNKSWLQTHNIIRTC